jgi:hypothetical protein
LLERIELFRQIELISELDQQHMRSLTRNTCRIILVQCLQDQP